VSWYTWLEQGRDVNVSAEVLDAIGGVLRLTEPERAHLYLLVLADAGIAAVTIPRRSSRANASMEQFVLTIRTEVTNRRLISGQRHLRAVLTDYARHDNRRRLHHALHHHPPRPDHPVTHISTERIKRRSVLGGLINE